MVITSYGSIGGEVYDEEVSDLEAGYDDDDDGEPRTRPRAHTPLIRRSYNASPPSYTSFGDQSLMSRYSSVAGDLKIIFLSRFGVKSSHSTKTNSEI